jgi:hypothetical protein
MREFFIIKTGTPDYDEHVEELNLYYERDKIAYMFILIGGILVVVSLL